ncbi:hypothetical protein M413DRAFT_281152 [Hebeloma cylindrosporum]|uniref:Uncharacterized protein n=1 Tax=Hebeloma cylindrosporum TaxID=76867 RepID=A0A0C2Y7R6_HEBCY|nr:hypothetical protein M413DRAFT_281152 [Hebeloma cylindrosporum h7]
MKSFDDSLSTSGFPSSPIKSLEMSSQTNPGSAMSLPAGSLGLDASVLELSLSSSSPGDSSGFPCSSEPTHAYIYSPEFMLSLRPNAVERVKEKIRETCPEAVMSRRMRKTLEFAQHQREAAERKFHYYQPSSPEAAAIAFPSPFSASINPSIECFIPRASRLIGRATERRRQALQSNLQDNWRGHVSTISQPLAVV